MESSENLFEESALDKAIQLQDGLVARATGNGFAGGDPAYKELRQFFALRGDTKSMLPDFVRRCNDLAQFWSFIKQKFSSYQERREYIWEAFRPLITKLELHDRAPGVVPITEVIQAFDSDYVQSSWQKALDRRGVDPEGAITAARTLIETICKHILDDADVVYSDNSDLPKLWTLTAEQIKLAPSQHQEEVFKAILGNCQSVVFHLSAIRNRVGDAHGQGRRPVRPKPRHAELAVNLAGAMAAFLVATWQERIDQQDHRS